MLFIFSSGFCCFKWHPEIYVTNKENMLTNYLLIYISNHWYNDWSINPFNQYYSRPKYILGIDAEDRWVNTTHKVPALVEHISQ